MYYEGAQSSDGSTEVPAGAMEGVKLKGTIAVSGCQDYSVANRPCCLEIIGIPKSLLVQAQDDTALAALKEAVAKAVHSCSETSGSWLQTTPVGSQTDMFACASTSSSENVLRGMTVPSEDCLVDVRVTLNDFEIGRVLGRGMFATVALVTKKDSRRQYALKSLNKKEVPKLRR